MRCMKKNILPVIALAVFATIFGCGKADKKVSDENKVAVMEASEDTSEISEEISEDGKEKYTTDDENSSQAAHISDEEGAIKESDKLVEDILSGMSLREKVCQMMFVTPESITGEENVAVAGEATKQALTDYPVGGIVYFAQNFESTGQTKEMIANSQSYSRIGLFIATDEEGGVVNRLMNTLGTTYIDSMYTYKDEGTDKAYENAFTIASDMSELGFNLDFAPVADVWSNPDNTVIGARAYSDDYSQAAELVKSAVKGFEDGGVMCTLKHFPGHGDTAEDSHYGSAYVNKTKEQIMEEEMQPFESGINAGADFVMVGHLIVPDIDELPASLSYQITTVMLRQEINFEGLTITDSLAMSSIADNYAVGDSSVMAVKAGIDMLLAPEDVETAVSAICGAVESGDISEERIDESVRRILSLKEKKGLIR